MARTALRAVLQTMVVHGVRRSRRRRVGRHGAHGLRDDQTDILARSTSVRVWDRRVVDVVEDVVY